MDDLNYYRKLSVVLNIGSVKFLAARIRHSDNSEKVRLHIEKKGQIEACVDFTLQEMTQKVFKAKNYGVALSCADIQAIINNINDQYDNIPVVFTPFEQGFQYDVFTRKITGYAGAKMLSANGKEIVKDPYADLPKSKGSIEDSKNMLVSYLLKNVKRQIVFLWSLASIVCALLNKTILLSLTTSSSQGKTTVAKLSLSSFSNTNFSKIMRTWASTDNALTKALNNVFGVPMLIDDTSLRSEKSDFGRIIYEFINGTSKARLTKGTELSLDSHWATSIISTSEFSIVDTCNPDFEGILPRIFEMNCSKGDLTDDEKEANYLQNFTKSSYGLIGPLFVQYLLTNGIPDLIDEEYTKEVSSIRDKIQSDEAIIQRAIETIAIITLTAKYLTKALQLNFETDQITECMLAIYRDEIENFRDRNPRTHIIDSIYPSLVEYSKIHCSQYQRNNYVVIDNQTLKQFLTDINTRITIKTLKQELSRKNLLFMPRGAYSDTFTFDKKSIRGIALIINTEGDNNNE